MKKEIIGILIVGVLVLSGIGVSAITNEFNTVLRYGDELDQYQTEMSTAGYIGAIDSFYNFIAQSFIPQKEVLTCIQLLIGRNASTTSPYSLAIREDLTGENLAVVSVNAEDIPVKKNLSDLAWIEFDFDDMVLTAGHTYHMVSFTVNETDNFYYWGGLWSDPYPNGAVFLSMDGGTNWIDVFYIDMCFKTFGSDNHPPDAPEIAGPTSGKPGVEYVFVFSTEDPEDDDVSYYVEWGDGESTGWTDYYESGIDVAISHTWEEIDWDNILRCKAKDIYGAESNWSDRPIRISKNKPYNINLLEQSTQQSSFIPSSQNVMSVVPSSGTVDIEKNEINEVNDNALSDQDLAELENVWINLADRFQDAETQDEKIDILKEIPVVSDKYGLLPEDLTVEEAQELIVSAYLETIASSSLQSDKQSNDAGDSLLAFSKSVVPSALPQLQVSKSNRIVNNDIKLNTRLPKPSDYYTYLIYRGFGLISNPKRSAGPCDYVWSFHCEDVIGCIRYNNDFPCTNYHYTNGEYRFIEGDPTIVTNKFMFRGVPFIFFWITE